jgi:hypothetical protein
MTIAQINDVTGSKQSTMSLDDSSHNNLLAQACSSKIHRVRSPETAWAGGCKIGKHAD